MLLDQWDVFPGSDLGAYVESSVRQSDFVVLVCTPEFCRKANAGEGGVGYEKTIVTGQILSGAGNPNRFVPVLRAGDQRSSLPTYLQSRVYIDFKDDDRFADALSELLRFFHSAPRHSRPPLGPVPAFAAVGSPTESLSETSAMDEPELDEEWREKHLHKALRGYSDSAASVYMEIFSQVYPPLPERDSSELLKAADASMIRTFGWPIGVMSLSADHMRPKPTPDGIVNIVTAEKKMYDYWALRGDGAYFLLKTLFEEARDRNELFLDTRIVRTTEVVMYLSKLYEALGATPDSTVRIDIGYSGLRGRKLGATPGRPFWRPSGPAEVDDAKSTVVTSVERLRTRIVDNVLSLTRPLFMLFDFAEIDREVYEQIVGDFQRGRIS